MVTKKKIGKVGKTETIIISLFILFSISFKYVAQESPKPQYRMQYVAQSKKLNHRVFVLYM